MKSIHTPLYLAVAVAGAILGTALFSDFLQPSVGEPRWLHDPLHADELEPADSMPEEATANSDFEAAIATVEAPPNRPADESQTQTQTSSTVDTRKSASGPTLRTPLGDVDIFPANNPWNQRIDHLPVHPKSAIWIKSIGPGRKLHPDFGTVWQGAPNGIPYVVVSSNQAKVPVSFEYDDESDPGPYPIPPNPPIEGGPKADPDSDRHIIMIDPKKKLLYELFQVLPTRNGGWKAGSGAIFDLSTNKLRPDGWTSADAAGLPIFPGLVRYDEVKSGEIRHALRFTVEVTQKGYIFPARHFASRTRDRTEPPMGLRVRLKKNYDISRFPKSAQVILIALKRYGMLLADNGGDWFISGAPDPRWSDDELATLKRVKGRDLECVLTGPVKQR